MAAVGVSGLTEFVAKEGDSRKGSLVFSALCFAASQKLWAERQIGQVVVLCKNPKMLASWLDDKAADLIDFVAGPPPELPIEYQQYQLPIVRILPPTDSVPTQQPSGRQQSQHIQQQQQYVQQQGVQYSFNGMVLVPESDNKSVASSEGEKEPLDEDECDDGSSDGSEEAESETHVGGGGGEIDEFLKEIQHTHVAHTMDAETAAANIISALDDLLAD
eukprot:GDKI01002441.1.p1 GENE.GDKI01002441.1~~GDKI01002441.1.p1  ORF type:complete len:218 (+),score=45.10 GDKI01002441.1:44-697(+)